MRVLKRLDLVVLLILIFPASSGHTGPTIDIIAANTVTKVRKRFIIAVLSIELLFVSRGGLRERYWPLPRRLH